MKPARVALAALLAWAAGGCTKSAGPAEEAKAFFDLITAGKAEAAFERTSFGFRDQQTLNYFTTSLHELGLDTITGAKYSAPEYRDARETARVPAEFATKAKGTLRLVVGLGLDNGVWRVLSIKTPRDAETGTIINHFSMVGKDPGFNDPTTRFDLPSDSVAMSMTEGSLLEFAAAINSKSFLDFFDHCSLRWQEQLATGEPAVIMAGTMRKPLTPRQRELGAGRLQHAFEAFIDGGVNIAGIQGVTPVFDRPPWVSTDGLLVISGHYPTQPHQVVFTLRYCYELPLWKLFGVEVKLRPVSSKG